MRMYFAPMEGLTDHIYRRAHHDIFGAAGAPTRYYAPFLSPPLHQTLIEKKMRDVLPEQNEGIDLVPQILSKDAPSTVWMLGELRKLGYTEVNLNFGCPAGTVTAKGKGAGILRDPAAMDAYLYEVFAADPGPISVKTRLGVVSAEEFERILEVYNKYPICELTIHPRVMRQMYRGSADRAAFAAALPQCRMPVCYNGDITAPEQIEDTARAFPQIGAVMVGRGLIADPALLRRAAGGPAASKEELRLFLDRLYREYSVEFGGPKSAINRMKAIWPYVFSLFEEPEQLERQLRKVREPWEYETVAGQVFARLTLRAK